MAQPMGNRKVSPGEARVMMAQKKNSYYDDLRKQAIDNLTAAANASLGNISNNNRYSSYAEQMSDQTWMPKQSSIIDIFKKA